MGKYTPAPWRVETNHLNIGLPKVKAPYIIDGPDFAPALILGDGKSNFGVALANANLISAAPELLAAAEKCSDAFVSWQVGQIPGRPEDILNLITQV